MITNLRPSAFIANLREYNEGNLVGKWIEFPTTESNFIEHLRSIGIDNSIYRDEYFIADHEYFIGIDQYASYEELNKFALLSLQIIKRSDYEEVFSKSENMRFLKEIIEEKLDDGESLESIHEYISNFKVFYGTDGIMSALKNFGYYLLEELDYLNHGMLDDNVKMYIDVESFAKDKFIEMKNEVYSLEDRETNTTILVIADI